MVITNLSILGRGILRFKHYCKKFLGRHEREKERNKREIFLRIIMEKMVKEEIYRVRRVY